jgi:hypothetical protein
LCSSSLTTPPKGKSKQTSRHTTPSPARYVHFPQLNETSFYTPSHLEPQDFFTPPQQPDSPSTPTRSTSRSTLTLLAPRSERIYHTPRTRSQQPALLGELPAPTRKPKYKEEPKETELYQPPTTPSRATSPSQFGLENPETLPSILEGESDDENFHHLPENPEEDQDFQNKEGQHLIYSADAEEHPELPGTSNQLSTPSGSNTESETEPETEPETENLPSTQTMASQTQTITQTATGAGGPPSEPDQEETGIQFDDPISGNPPNRRRRSPSSAPSSTSSHRGRRRRDRNETPAIQRAPGDSGYEKEIGQKPPNFNGVTPKFKTWWMLVKNYLGLNPIAFQNDQRQIRFVLGLMTEGKAGDWSEKYYWDHTHDEHGNDVPWKYQYFEEFETDILKQFTPVDEQINAQREFYEIHQGNKTAADFNLEFQKLALTAGISDNKALMEQYKRSLNEGLARDIWTRREGPPDTIDEWYIEAVRRDVLNRQANALWPKRHLPPPRNNYPQRFPHQNPQYRRHINEVHMDYEYPEVQNDYYPENSHYEPIQEYPNYETESYDEEDPEMQLNAVFTTAQVERYKSGRCIGCGASNHMIKDCPKPDPNLSRHPPPKRNNPPPRRFPQPPPRRPFNGNRNPPPGPRKISVLEIQNMIRELPLDDRMEF